jgi:hypothetical protein
VLGRRFKLKSAVRTTIAPMSLPRDTPRPPPGSTLELEPVEDEDEDGVLPFGVEPWSGEDMPAGTASSHALFAASEDDVQDAWLPPDGVETSRGHEAPAADAPGLSPSLPPESESEPIGETDELNYRHIYETRFRMLDVGLREEAARRASSGELFALCLDPSAQVVSALLENPQFGPGHARSVAQHHATDRGLEILARRAQLLRDSHVQRRLLQNIQAPDVVLDRVLRLKRLIDVYRLSVDRDLPERNRVRVRSRLRPIFTRAEPEDRVALIMKTEGRCLINLSGCAFDSRTTQMLCTQTIASTLFIQNLARFPATPPLLIAKLLRSAPVQRQPQLRALLMKHPNAGSEAKRRG